MDIKAAVLATLSTVICLTAFILFCLFPLHGFAIFFIGVALFAIFGMWSAFYKRFNNIPIRTYYNFANHAKPIDTKPN